MELTATRTLSEDQTEAFDVEYVNDDLWRILEPQLKTRLSGPSRFLDVGGGNGMLVDRILNAFPESEGVNLEPANNLVLANAAHPRKTVVPAMLQDLNVDEAGKFDVITINWVIHHLIVDNYGGTLDCQADALRQLGRLLKPGGAILAFENIYDGAVIDEAPSRLIFELTASKLLARVTAKMGANTAGVGVCFHSETGWRKVFRAAGLDVTGFSPCYSFGSLSPIKKAILHLKDSRVGLFTATQPRHPADA